MKIIEVISRLIIFMMVLFSCTNAFCEKEAAPHSAGIQIGAVLPLTGPGAFYGQELQAGLQFCNKAGLISVNYQDSQGAPNVGVSAFQQLLLQPKMDLVVSAFSPISKAIIPIARERGVPLLMTVVSAAGLNQGKDSSIFRFFTSGEQEGPILARFVARSAGFKRVAILYQEDDYGLSYKNAFAKTFEAEGGKVVTAEQFLRTENDFRSALSKIKGKKPDAIFFIGLEEHDKIVVRQMRELQMSSVLVLNWSALSSHVFKELSAELAEFYTMSPSFYFSESQVIKEFKEQFEKSYGKAPSAYAAIGCDIIRILEAAHAKGVRPLDYLKTLNKFEGLIGSLSVNENNEIPFDLYPVKVTNGHIDVKSKRGL